MQDLIQIIKTGNKDQVRAAQKELDRIWHQSKFPRSKAAIAPYNIFLEEIQHFDEIGSMKNQISFIYALKWPFMVMGDTNFAFFIGFILK